MGCGPWGHAESDTTEASAAATVLPILHQQFPRHGLKAWFLKPAKLFHQDLDDAIAFASSEAKCVFSFLDSDSLAGDFVLIITHLCD